METKCAMKNKRKVRERYSETGSEPSRIPRNYSCVEPARMSLVFDFLKDFKQDIKEPALMHLRLCLHCREVAVTLLKINRYLEPKSRHTPQTEKSEIVDEDHHGECIGTEDHKAKSYTNASQEDQETDFSSSSLSQ